MEIYKILNKITGKCYIGKTIIGYEKRFNKHKEHAHNKVNRRLYDSMNYHGIDNFEVELLHTCSSLEELNAKEVLAIKEYNSLTPNGYNMTTGGDGGNTLTKWSEEDKKALYTQQAKTRTGLKRTTEQKIRMSEAQKGKQISLEQRKKIATSLSERYKNLPTEEQSKVIQPLLENNYTRLGTSHSDKTKELMSKAKKGKTYEEIYKPEIAVKKREKAREIFINNNPRTYELPDIIKNKIIEMVYSNLKAEEISKKLNVSLYKMRQILQEIGIENLQEYKRTEEWKIKHENWLQSEELIKSQSTQMQID